MIKFKNFKIKAGTTVVVMAPHPDDFDAIAVTLKRLAGCGAKIMLAVMTGGASGVEDSFGDFVSDADKIQLREAEQRDSCRLFGLNDEAVSFLHLAEDDSSDLLQTPGNHQVIKAYLNKLKPMMVFMPHGHDTNLTHQVSYALVKSVIGQLPFKVDIMLNRDPKTIALEPDYYSGFDADEADWKGALLRCHKSQHQRNLNTRQHGFDYRILEFNRQTATEFKLPTTYVELFELDNS